jgi:hypothetical protein
VPLLLLLLPPAPAAAHDDAAPLLPHAAASPERSSAVSPVMNRTLCVTPVVFNALGV